MDAILTIAVQAIYWYRQRGYRRLVNFFQGIVGHEGVLRELSPQLVRFFLAAHFLYSFGYMGNALKLVLELFETSIEFAPWVGQGLAELMFVL
jgi:hypothetical protein